MGLVLALGAGSGVAAQQGVAIRPGRMMYVSLDTVDTPTVFPGTGASVYRKLIEVYRALKIPISLYDSTTGKVGNIGVNLRSIDGQRMSTWLGCGVGLTGPNADMHRVTASIISWVQPRGRDSAVVRTGVFAGVTNMAEAGSSLPRPCDTTGRLEERIRTLLRRRLAAP